MNKPPVEQLEFMRAKRAEFLRLVVAASAVAVVAAVAVGGARGEIHVASVAVQVYSLMCAFWQSLAFALPAACREGDEATAR
mmetsp:Transcript_57299/g.166273  ORF Transcript_57299/g.166273 Transcript_57299/m.166273 type:complete len:82 (+) Transcript_57299:400-645(+)